VDRDDPFDVLEGHRYMVLTTFRRSGAAVPTTVWFARRGDRLLVFTDVESGKARRIRNDPRVRLAPGDFRGRPLGRSVEAVARILDGAEESVADRALREKYGWQYRTFRAVLRWQGKDSRSAFLEIRPEAGPE